VFVLPQCISELPNSVREIRSFTDHNSRLVEGIILNRIVTPQLTLRSASFRAQARSNGARRPA